ncbi:MAG: hypothetical protein HY951_10965 [Bacteroidia bacterium]|nr:hypothetical protein [Bacteroidia bacterium]
MKNYSIKLSVFLLLIIVIFFNHFFGYVGHYGWDDMEYARLAKQWADGNFDLTLNHFTYRWTIIGFTGLSYMLFGMSDFASAIPSMFITVLSLAIIFWITRKMSKMVSVIAMSLFVLNQWTLFYSDKIMPDSYVALGILGAFATIWHYRFEKLGKYTILHAIIFSGFLLFAFISKETVFLIIPVLLFVFVSDIWQKRNIKFWIYSVITGAVFLIGYFLLLNMKTGNPWIRFEAISQNSYINPCRYDLLPLGDLLERISYKLWFEFIKQIMITGFIFIIPSILSVRFREWLRMPCQESYFIAIATVALISGNFMTTSFSAYVPMCLDVRHYLFVSPLLAIAAAPFVLKFFQLREIRFALLFTSLFFLFISIINGFNDALYVLIPLTAIIAVRSFLPVFIPAKLRQALIVLFILLLFVQPVIVMFTNRSMKFNDIGVLLKARFQNNKEKNIVISDPVLTRISPYYLEFDTTNTRFISYFDAQNFKFNNEKVYILINDYTTWISEMIPERLPLFLKDFRDTAFVKVDSTINMRLYEVPKHEYLLVKGKEIKFENGFEYDTLSAWEINPLSLIREKYFTGLRSNSIPGQGYSSTLVCPLNMLISDSTYWVDVTLSTAIFLTDSSEGQMVMSLEVPNAKSLVWLGKSLRSELRNSNEWNRIAYTNRIYIPQDSTRNTLFFKLYFWNDHSKPFYIDDVEVSFKCVNQL